MEKKILDKNFEIDKSKIMYDGEIISANPFQIKGEDGKTYFLKKGGVGGINLQKPQFDKLKNIGIPVTNDSSAILVIDFPLKKAIGYKIYSKNGFTKKQLVTEISKVYSEIYADRKKYEICCHNFCDLELHNVLVFKKDGLTYLITMVESIK